MLFHLVACVVLSDALKVAKSLRMKLSLFPVMHAIMHFVFIPPCSLVQRP